MSIKVSTETKNNNYIIDKLIKIIEFYNSLYNNFKNNNQEIIYNKINNNIHNKNASDNSSDEEYDDQYRDIRHRITKKNDNKNLFNKNIFIISQNYEHIINSANLFISNEDESSAYSLYNEILLNIKNSLIYDVLNNSPLTDIIYTSFDNIKTELYPYQINNVNWMLNIENNNYEEIYNDIKKIMYFRGGGLFDEVGMGKTLQIITLINVNKSKYNSTIKNNKLYTRATIIIVPNHLCLQWEREFSLHLKKNIKIISLLTKRHYNKFTYFDIINSDVVIVSSNFFKNCKINQHEEYDPLFNITNIFNTDVNIFNIFWHRTVIDEFHEIEDSNLFQKLKFIESDYRWIISGTPFKQHSILKNNDFQNTSLSKIIDFLTYSVNIVNVIELDNQIEYDFVKDHFSRNSHQKNMSILKLPNIIEETVWLKFTETERMIYNAYIADPNNSEYDVFLRQICCHPLLSEKIREKTTSSLNNLTEMGEFIKSMYFKEYDDVLQNYNECLDRRNKIISEIKRLEKEDKTNLITYSNLKEDLDRNSVRLEELNNVKNGKEKTVSYYKNFIDLISDVDKVKQESCPICLDFIKEEDLGITICGHMFCYTCINFIIKNSSAGSKCPSCNKPIQMDKIFLIGAPKSKDIEELGTKLAYIINYIKSTPDKYRIIFSQWDYLLKEVGKVLDKNNINHLYCQGNVYQKDKVLRLFNSPNTADNKYKIIMLSSDSTVSGSNLNNAEEVIFLDPVYGDKQYRLNTENQAIGRVRRLGNKFKDIKVIRLLIENSIEQVIFNSNK